MGGAIEQFALFGQDQAAGMAVEELDADILLQRGDLAADGRLGQVQLVGGMGKGPSFRSRMKNAQFVPVQRHAGPPHGAYSAACCVSTGRADRKRSASSAAMQPMPAAVIAWR